MNLEHPMPEKPAKTGFNFLWVMVLITIAIFGLLAYISLSLTFESAKKPKSEAVTPSPTPAPTKPEPQVLSYTWTHSGIVRVTIINNGAEGWCKVTVSVYEIRDGLVIHSQTLRVYLKQGESTTLEFVFNCYIEAEQLIEITAKGE
ncbi:MAG: hypothetical protein QXD95_07485 [Nitrososphaeria archaeon]